MTKSTKSVNIKVLQKDGLKHTHYWRWPPKVNMQKVPFTDLVATLPTPQLIPGANIYSNPEMVQYGW